MFGRRKQSDAENIARLIINNFVEDPQNTFGVERMFPASQAKFAGEKRALFAENVKFFRFLIVVYALDEADRQTAGKIRDILVEFNKRMSPTLVTIPLHDLNRRLAEVDEFINDWRKGSGSLAYLHEWLKGIDIDVTNPLELSAFSNFLLRTYTGMAEMLQAVAKSM